MATIQIKKLKIPVIVGTHPDERKKKQEILFDIMFDYDAEDAIKTDDVAQAVDYESLVQNIINEISNSQFFIIEKLADFVLDVVMKEQRIQKAAVTVYKLKAVKNTKNISVYLSRER